MFKTKLSLDEQRHLENAKALIGDCKLQNSKFCSVLNIIIKLAIESSERKLNAGDMKENSIP